jgi:hypothetical protein
MRYSAIKMTVWGSRTLAAVWAGWWIFFGIASGIGEKLDLFGILMHTLVPGLVFGLVFLLAWKWEAAGGILLVAMGALVTVGYPMMMFRNRPIRWDWYSFILLTMALPPLISGILLLWHWRATHRRAV